MARCNMPTEEQLTILRLMVSTGRPLSRSMGSRDRFRLDGRSVPEQQVVAMVAKGYLTRHVGTDCVELRLSELGRSTEFVHAQVKVRELVS
jgi:hypothetical protein